MPGRRESASCSPGCCATSWGFDGVGRRRLLRRRLPARSCTRVAADRGEAAELALKAGIDVELPTGDAYLAPLADRIRAGESRRGATSTAPCCASSLRKRSSACSTRGVRGEPARRDRSGHAAAPRRSRGGWPRSRSCCCRTTAPCRSPAAGRRIARDRPERRRAEALQGCYSFANHVLAHHPESPLGFAIPTVLRGARRTSCRSRELVHADGCDVEGDDRSGFAEAVARRRGRRSRDRRRRRPGRTVRPRHRRRGQRRGVAGTARRPARTGRARSSPPGRPSSWSCSPAGRTRSTGRWTASRRALPPCCRPSSRARRAARRSPRCSPGEASPSGRLPLSLPRSSGAQPYCYLHPILGGASDVTSADPHAAAAVRLRAVLHDLRVRRLRGVRRRRGPTAPSPRP